MVPQRVAHQQQVRQEQGVRFHHPLYVSNRGVDFYLYDREGHIDHCAINKGQAGAEYGGRQRPRALPPPTPGSLHNLCLTDTPTGI